MRLPFTHRAEQAKAKWHATAWLGRCGGNGSLFSHRNLGPWTRNVHCSRPQNPERLVGHRLHQAPATRSLEFSLEAALHMTSFPNSSLGTPLPETPFREPSPFRELSQRFVCDWQSVLRTGRRTRNRVSRKCVPKPELGNEKSRSARKGAPATHRIASHGQRLAAALDLRDAQAFSFQMLIASYST